MTDIDLEKSELIKLLYAGILEGVKYSHQIAVQLVIWLVVGNGVMAMFILDGVVNLRISFSLLTQISLGAFALGVVATVGSAGRLYNMNSKAIVQATDLVASVSLNKTTSEKARSDFVGMEENMKKVGLELFFGSAGCFIVGGLVLLVSFNLSLAH